MEKALNPIARILMAQIFLLSGLSKIGAYAGTQAYMDSMGVPGALLPLVIVFELVGAASLILGFQVRWVALSLAGFSAASALIFHANLGDQMQMIMFMKNWAITGGLLLLATHGAGHYSLDQRLQRTRKQDGDEIGAAI